MPADAGINEAIVGALAGRGRPVRGAEQGEVVVGDPTIGLGRLECDAILDRQGGHSMCLRGLKIPELGAGFAVRRTVTIVSTQS